MPIKKPPPLSELQDWMRWLLTHPHGVGCALKNHSHPLQGCIKVIGETPEVSRETRLSIYGDGYFGRIVDVLGANYSSVKNVLGEKLFDDLARRYLIKYPSPFKSIDDIGGHLAHFLKAHPLLKKFPFLSDLASLEWAAHQAFFADDGPLFDPHEIKNVPETTWPKAKFTMDSSVRLLKINWPINGLWRADGKWTKRRLALMKNSSIHVLVFRRPDKFVRVPGISPLQYDLLAQLVKEKPLGEILRTLIKKYRVNEKSLPLGEWFNVWIAEGVIKKIKFK